MMLIRYTLFLVLSYKGYFHSVITETDELIMVNLFSLEGRKYVAVFLKKVKFGQAPF